MAAALGSWKRGDQIGEGTYGKVYLVDEPLSPDGKRMVVKEIPTSYSTDTFSEIEVLKSVQHDRIVPYYGMRENCGTVYIFTEYMEMGSLEKYIINNGPLDEQKTRLYTKQILTGLAFLHGNGIIHRDVKAGNVLMESEMSVKLIDFGLSKILGDMTSTGSMQKGTYHWMAPEVAMGEKQRYAVDIWSTGCTVVEMLTGNPPFPDSSPMEVVKKLASGNKPEYTLPSGLSRCVHDFLDTTLNPNPDKRPTAVQLLNHEFVKV